MIEYGHDYTCEHGETPEDCPRCAGPSKEDDRQPMTDLGNARRLVSAYGERLRHVPSWRKWLVWDGTRWARDVTGEPARCAKIVARRMYRDAEAVEDEELRKALLGSARRAESANGIRAMLELASTELEVALAPDQLDSNVSVLNTMSGTLDLETGVLFGHRPADNLTKVTAVGYVQDASAPEFAKFLERVQPDPQMREFLARLLGHTVSGKVHEHILPIFHGVGANGKSTLVEAVRKVLGDYAASVDPALLVDRGDSHPTGVADLFGLRLALTHETDQGRRLAEGTIKRLTGGDMITARRMREDFWSFDPTHSIIMITNHQPVVTGTDEGIWRRLRIVPFSVVVPVEERDPELPKRLEAEGEGILRWLIDGYRSYLQHGLDEPSSVTEATTAYRTGADMLGLFINERCLIMNDFRVKSSLLFEAWQKWCTAENVEPGTQTAFSTALAERGFDKVKSSGVIFWKGIGLASEEEAP